MCKSVEHKWGGSLKRVWVVQEGNNDYSAAEDFGEVRFITRTDVTAVANSQQNENVMADIRRFLSEYIPGTDFIIPAGNPIVISTVMMSVPQGNHSLLKWDGRRATYIPFKVSPQIIQ